MVRIKTLSKRTIGLMSVPNTMFIIIVFPVVIPGRNFLFWEREGKLQMPWEGKGNLRLVFPGITGNGYSRSPLPGLPFLAALAALGLPWSLTYSLFCHCVGFEAFQPSRPNRNRANLMGVMRKHDLTNKISLKLSHLL